MAHDMMLFRACYVEAVTGIDKTKMKMQIVRSWDEKTLKTATVEVEVDLAYETATGTKDHRNWKQAEIDAGAGNSLSMLYGPRADAMFAGAVYLRDDIASAKDIPPVPPFYKYSHDYEFQLLIQPDDEECRRYVGFHAKVVERDSKSRVLLAIYNSSSKRRSAYEPAVVKWVDLSDRKEFAAPGVTPGKGPWIDLKAHVLEGAVFYEQERARLHGLTLPTILSRPGDRLHGKNPPGSAEPVAPGFPG